MPLSKFPTRRRVVNPSRKAIQAKNLCLELMRRHRLFGWRFRFIKSKRTAGRCLVPSDGSPGMIELSVDVIEVNTWEDITDTILHEIAHALVGVDHGHDSVWRQMAIRIGAKPIRCSTSKTAPTGRWQANCPNCRKPYHRYRRPKNPSGWFCPPCGQDKGSLVYTCVR